MDKIYYFVGISITWIVIVSFIWLVLFLFFVFVKHWINNSYHGDFIRYYFGCKVDSELCRIVYKHSFLKNQRRLMLKYRLRNIRHEKKS